MTSVDIYAVSVLGNISGIELWIIFCNCLPDYL